MGIYLKSVMGLTLSLLLCFLVSYVVVVSIIFHQLSFCFFVCLLWFKHFQRSFIVPCYVNVVSMLFECLFMLYKLGFFCFLPAIVEFWFEPYVNVFTRIGHLKPSPCAIPSFETVFDVSLKSRIVQDFLHGSFFITWAVLLPKLIQGLIWLISVKVKGTICK